MKTKNTVLTSLIHNSNIAANKQFQRLAEKTQVVMPQNGQYEVVNNRYTHSYEVANSSLMIATFIASELNLSINDIDYQHVLFGCSLTHDIGHSAFGHDGAEYLDSYFKNIGVNDGFSDNNNNLVVIDKNNIEVSDYLISSIIKYPTKLYGFQKKKYLPILDEALEEDHIYYKSIGFNLVNQKTTIACQIMDEADRNSYTCSDLSDFLCLGHSIDLLTFYQIAHEEHIDYEYKELNSFAELIKFNSKSVIKKYFNSLKNKFNCNYQLTDKGIVVVDQKLENFREFLSKLCFVFFISPIRHNNFHQSNMTAFKDYIDDVVNGKYSPSDIYTLKIQNAKNEIQKYTYMRDMIAEVSDWYILNYKNNLEKEEPTI